MDTATETTTPKRGGFTPEMRAKAAATRARKAAQRQARAAAKEAKATVERPPAPASNDEFAGMTKIACCDACGPNGCVVSGRNVCAHPNKGGLQAAQMRDKSALARLQRAKEYLAKTGVS